MGDTRVESDAAYEKMSTSDLDKAVQTLSKRLTGGTSYAGYAEDSARFAAAERVMQQRNITDPPKRWRTPK